MFCYNIFSESLIFFYLKFFFKVSIQFIKFVTDHAFDIVFKKLWVWGCDSAGRSVRFLCKHGDLSSGPQLQRISQA